MELSCARSGDLVLRDESRQSWEGNSVLIRLMPWALPQGYRKLDVEKVSGERQRRLQDAGLQERQLW